MKALIILLLASVTAGSFAEGYEEARRKCHYTDYYCKKEWNEKNGDENAARRVEAMRAKNAETKALEDAEQARKKQAAEEAHRAREVADRKALRDTEAAVEQQRRDDEARQKKACGKDFGVLRVGMPLARFEECYEALSFVMESFDKGGAVETYRATFFLIHARNGRIVSYTRRTR